MFCINLAGGFLRDGYKVLYIENEDPDDVTISRLISRLSGLSIFELNEKPEDFSKIQTKIEGMGYNNFLLKGLSPGTFSEIQGLIDRHKPDIVIINQLRNMWVGKSVAGNKVEQLERAATSARNLAKKNNILVVSVTQAGDSATDKLVLDMGDVDFSNTGIPSQMDLMIGIGVNEDFQRNNQRMISLPKNKLSGEHVYFPVVINPHICKVTSL